MCYVVREKLWISEEDVVEENLWVRMVKVATPPHLTLYKDLITDGDGMTCTKAQIILLLDKIKEELGCEEDRKALEDRIERIRKTVWTEIVREFY